MWARGHFSLFIIKENTPNQAVCCYKRYLRTILIISEVQVTFAVL